MATPKPDVQLEDEDITRLDLIDSEELPPVFRQGSLRSRSSGSQSVLSLTLDPDLLRGVSAAAALSGWCKHWSPKTKATNVHHLSRPVHSIDTFLSHDWETSRWTKLMTLLMVLNSRASAVAGLLTSILVGILRITHILPDETWTVCFVYIALFGVLCFWQRIRSLFPGHQMVFLDKLCINQMDSEKKQQGILGLGAFVLRSKKLLVLWSPRYFTRMWCTYEIGCFLSHGQTSRQIEILPVKLALILIPTALLWHSLMIGFHLLRGGFVRSLEEVTPSGILYVGSAMLLLASSLLPMVNYLGMSMMREVQELPRQLENFEVQKAECFCCTHHHRHPQTGEEMICDRELIYETLEELYHSKPGEDALSGFNRRVQERLRPKVLRRIGGEFPLRYVVSMVLVSNLPFLSELISKLNKGPPVLLDGFGQAIFALRLILLWVQPCLSMLFSLKFSQWIWGIFNFKSSVCLAIWTSPLISLAVACTWISMEVMIFVTPDNSMLPILAFLAVFALDTYLYVDIFDIFKKSTGRQPEPSFRDTPPSTEVGDASLAVDVDLVCDKWEIEEDGDTMVTWKF